MGILPDKKLRLQAYSSDYGYNAAIDECKQAMDKAVEKASNIKKLDRIIYENGHRTIEEMAQAISTYIKSCFE